MNSSIDEERNMNHNDYQKGKNSLGFYKRPCF